MKNQFRIVFMGLFFLSLATGLLPGAVVAFAGFMFTLGSYKSPIAAAGIALYPQEYFVQDSVGAIRPVPFSGTAERALFEQLVILNRSNPVTADAIKDGGISYDPINYYIRYNITGLAGTVKFLNEATMRVLGTTNFPNGATLQQYYNFCFDKIIVRTALTNTANTTFGATTQWTNVSASMDPAVRNGELIIRSNKNVIVQTPVMDFISEAAVTGGGSKENAGGYLAKPRFFLENILASGELDLAGTVSSAANTTVHLEVVFCGVQARLKA